MLFHIQLSFCNKYLSFADLRIVVHFKPGWYKTLLPDQSQSHVDMIILTPDLNMLLYLVAFFQPLKSLTVTRITFKNIHLLDTDVVA